MKNTFFLNHLLLLLPTTTTTITTTIISTAIIITIIIIILEIWSIVFREAPSTLIEVWYMTAGRISVLPLLPSS